jgi:hypothetical protein
MFQAVTYLQTKVVIPIILSGKTVYYLSNKRSLERCEKLHIQRTNDMSVSGVSVKTKNNKL